VLHSVLSCAEDDLKRKVIHRMESIFFFKVDCSIFRKITNFRVNYTHYIA